MSPDGFDKRQVDMYDNKIILKLIINFKGPYYLGFNMSFLANPIKWFDTINEQILLSQELLRV